MPCIEREVLLGHFAAAAAAYNTAVVRMKDLNGLEFQQAWDDAEPLLEDREVARQDLADHDRDHGCLRKPAASVRAELIAAKAGA